MILLTLSAKCSNKFSARLIMGTIITRKQGNNTYYLYQVSIGTWQCRKWAVWKCVFLDVIFFQKFMYKFFFLLYFLLFSAGFEVIGRSVRQYGKHYGDPYPSKTPGLLHCLHFHAVANTTDAKRKILENLAINLKRNTFCHFDSIAILQSSKI